MRKYYEENHEKILKQRNERDETLEETLEGEVEVKLTKEEERIEFLKAEIKKKRDEEHLKILKEAYKKLEEED